MKLRLKSDTATKVLWLFAGVAGACVLASADAQAHKAKPAPLMSASSGPSNGPGADFPVVLGEQYAVGNTVYTPADVMNYDAVGYVAVDGAGAGISAAHHTLPIPSYVEVTSLASGRTILVRVDRRGPMDSNRVISLSQGAAAQLGIGDHDTVRVRRVNPPEPERAALRAGGAAPERMPTPQPLLAVLTRRLGPDEPVSLTGAPPPVRPAGTVSMTPPAYAPAPVAPAQYSPPPHAAAYSSAPQRYVPPSAAASDLAPMPPEAGAGYVPSAPARAAPTPPQQTPRQYAPAYASAPPQPVAPAQQAYAAPPPQYVAPPPDQAEPNGPPVPFRSYLIQPLRRAPDGSVLMPGTDAPAYPTPAFPTAGVRPDRNGAVYAYGPPTTPGAGQVAMARAPEQHSYLIPPLSRMPTGATGGTVVQPETLNRGGRQNAQARVSKHLVVKRRGSEDANFSAKPLRKPAVAKPRETNLAIPASPAPLATSGSQTLIVQAGAYSVRGRAEEVAQAIGGVVSLSGRVWRVRCGPFASRDGAEAALAKVKAAGYSGARIQRAD